VVLRPRKGSAAVCSLCNLPAPGNGQLAERRFEFIPLWGFFVVLLYAMRPVDCRRCGGVAVDDQDPTVGQERGVVPRARRRHRAGWVNVPGDCASAIYGSWAGQAQQEKRKNKTGFHLKTPKSDCTPIVTLSGLQRSRARS